MLIHICLRANGKAGQPEGMQMCMAADSQLAGKHQCSLNFPPPTKHTLVSTHHVTCTLSEINRLQ